MTSTQKLVAVGALLALGAAAGAFATGNTAGGVVIVVANVAWLAWAFWRAR